jgi:hypothetical protein
MRETNPRTVKWSEFTPAGKRAAIQRRARFSRLASRLACDRLAG